MDELTIEDIIDALAWEGFRLFTKPMNWPKTTGFRAFIDRPETGYERWDNDQDHPTEAEAIRDVYARFLPSAMGGQDAG